MRQLAALAGCICCAAQETKIMNKGLVETHSIHFQGQEPPTTHLPPALPALLRLLLLLLCLLQLQRVLAAPPSIATRPRARARLLRGLLLQLVLVVLGRCFVCVHETSRQRWRLGRAGVQLQCASLPSAATKGWQPNHPHKETSIDGIQNQKSMKICAQSTAAVFAQSTISVALCTKTHSHPHYHPAFLDFPTAPHLLPAPSCRGRCCCRWGSPPHQQTPLYCPNVLAA